MINKIFRTRFINPSAYIHRTNKRFFCEEPKSETTKPTRERKNRLSKDERERKIREIERKLILEELDAQKHSYNQSKQGAKLFAKTRFSGFVILLALGGGLAGFILLNGEIYNDPLTGNKSFCFFNKKVKIQKILIFLETHLIE